MRSENYNKGSSFLMKLEKCETNFGTERENLIL